MVNRRDVLKVAAGGAATLAGLLPAHRAGTQSVPVRRDVMELALDDPIIRKLRQFVTEMRERSAASPHSWIGFANVHGRGEVLNKCQHGNWYFLPWHRAYLEMYEKAAREFLADDTFALPYWDWSTSRRVPPAFALERIDRRPNPLYSPVAGATNTEKRVVNTKLPDELVGTSWVEQVTKPNVFSPIGGGMPTHVVNGKTVVQDSLDQSWLSIGGAIGPIEMEAHNRIHRTVRGFMRTPGSPQDPLFLAHHCNVDRIWAGWVDRGGIDEQNPLWRDMTFENHFINPYGEFYSRTVRDLLVTRNLGYVYDDALTSAVAQNRSGSLASDAQFHELFDPRDTSTVARKRTLISAPATIEQPLSVALSLPPGKRLRSLHGMSPLAGEEEIFAVFREVHTGEGVDSMNLFLNKPDATRQTPVSDPHFVSCITFLHANATHNGNTHTAQCFFVNLTHTMARLNAKGNGRPIEPLTLQIVPLPDAGMNAGGTAVHIESIDIGIL